MMKRMIQLCVLFMALSIPFSAQALNDASRKSISSALEEGDFETIKETLEQYDDADEIIEKVDAVLDISDDLTYEVDDFEGKTWIYYGDITSIDKGHYGSNVIPYIYMGDGTTIYKVGFTYTEWLFFTEIKIKLSDGEMIDHVFDIGDLTRETVSGKMIYEATSVIMDYEELEKISESEGGFTIRFQSDTQYLDYDKAQIMIDRFIGIKTIKDAYEAVIEYIS